MQIQRFNNFNDQIPVPVMASVLENTHKRYFTEYGKYLFWSFRLNSDADLAFLAPNGHTATAWLTQPDGSNTPVADTGVLKLLCAFKYLYPTEPGFTPEYAQYTLMFEASSSEWLSRQDLQTATLDVPNLATDNESPLGYFRSLIFRESKMEGPLTFINSDNDVPVLRLATTDRLRDHRSLTDYVYMSDAMEMIYDLSTWLHTLDEKRPRTGIAKVHEDGSATCGVWSLLEYDEYTTPSEVLIHSLASGKSWRITDFKIIQKMHYMSNNQYLIGMEFTVPAECVETISMTRLSRMHNLVKFPKPLAYEGAAQEYVLRNFSFKPENIHPFKP